MMAHAGGPLAVLAGVIALLAATSALAAVLHRRTLAFVYPLVLIAAAVALAAHLDVLLADGVVTARLPIGLPSTGMRFRLDALSAFFGVIVDISVIVAALYGLGLDRSHELTGRVEPLLPLFVAAMNLVLLADDAFAFLFFWELMSVSSWLLVVSKHTDAECRQAGYVYLVMAAIGTMSLLFAFGSMAGVTASYGFDEIRGRQLAPLISGLVLAAAFIGAGSKAGIMPLHAWLPLAHPAAPSHVSALMSGAMTKVAVYGLLRIVLDLIGLSTSWWWSLPFILLGAATAVGGLIYAVVDSDLKRILAYSTVENIGIIFVGIGLAIAFKATGLPDAAAVAMAAALLHALNHSWIKSLLFLGAGAVQHATGRRDLDALGGLIHTMPQTAAFWLVGALAMSALPPLNGFVSEWLLFQAVLAGPKFPEPILRFLSPAVGAMLALAAGLAAACFVRAFGIAFLGRPRSPEAVAAHEVPGVQRFAMALLAGLCVLGGLFGSIAASVIAPVLKRLVGATLPPSGSGPTPFSLIAFDANRSVYDAPTIALFVLLSGLSTMLVVHWISNRRTRRAPAWDCGFPDPSPLTQYTASSFGQPLRRVYGSMAFGARERVDMPAPGDMRPARLTVDMTDYIWRAGYLAPAHAVAETSRRLNVLQFLSIRRYLVLMFLALVTLLLVTATWM